MKYNIQVLNMISKKGLDLLKSNLYTQVDELKASDAILARSANMHHMEFSKSLKAIARAGAGVNNIPLDKCNENGIVVFNTPGANANAVKELVICALFLSSRGVTQSVEWIKNYKGDNLEIDIEKNKSLFTGPEIAGKTLGVIGLGAIGMKVANAAEALGMRVLGFDPYISVDSAWQLSQHVEKALNIEALLNQADYISLHLPLLDSTKEFLDKEKMEQMKDGVRILNFARGSLVQDDDLIEALKQGKVSRYLTDFPNEKLLTQDKVICIPHLGASTPESEDNCAVMAVNQLKDFLENGNIRNSVNFPETILTRNGGTRLTIVNKNVPKMVGQITSILAELNLNISVMFNHHKGDLAYNIIDIDGEVEEHDLEKIKEIQGVIKTRLIK